MVFLTDEMDIRRMLREHFENLHNVGRNEKAIVNACGFDGVRNRYFRWISGEKVIDSEKDEKW